MIGTLKNRKNKEQTMDIAWNVCTNRWKRTSKEWSDFVRSLRWCEETIYQNVINDVTFYRHKCKKYKRL